MPVHVVAKQQITVGNDEFVEGAAPEGLFAAVFEADGETGYFYVLDQSRSGQQIQDAMPIYDVAHVADRHAPSLIEIGWSLDNCKVVLLINDVAHAIYDFSAKRGYCRTGLPSPCKGAGWDGHTWDDQALKLFADQA